MKEVIKVIKDNITFNKLPKDIQNNMIENQANDILISFDEGAYTKKTAKAAAKLYYKVWGNHTKYVLFHSNFHGIQANEQERFYENNK